MKPLKPTRDVFCLMFMLCIYIIGINATAISGEYEGVLKAYKGSTPVVDGILEEGEYADAEKLSGVRSWFSDTSPAAIFTEDLSVDIWVKHDGEALYFAFDVSDDVLYGFDIDRWLPENNPKANELSREGWPWFGDGVEIMLNPTFTWDSNGKKTCKGDGSSWQVVVSTHKSRLGGIGAGGLLEGEPRSGSLGEAAWNTYQQWILNGDMTAAVRLKSEAEGRGYIVEWQINANPCIQIEAGKYWNSSLGETKIGINFEIQDLDSKEAGQGNWSNFHHIDYWARVKPHSKTALKSWGTLILLPYQKSTSVQKKHLKPESVRLLTNYPNPFNPVTTIPFFLDHPSRVNLTILDVHGRTVRTLLNRKYQPGHFKVHWDGLGDDGEALPTALYLICLRTEMSQQIRKVSLIR